MLDVEASGSVFRRGWRVPILLALLLGALWQVAPAAAVVSGRVHARPRTGLNTQLTLSGLGPGSSVTGFIADTSNPFDPVSMGYPASDPTTGFTAKDESFAGVIHAQPPGSDAELSLYCIDIRTNTYIGLGYALGTWDASNVPNVGYVARLLNEYYPTTDQPAALTNLDQKAAAVQAAIWFFSDRYVLSTSDPLHDAVVAIVNHIRSQKPLTQPEPPTLTLTPSQVSGPADRVLGPFTVTTDHAPAAVTATGATMYSDPAGTIKIGDGTTGTVPSDQKIWVRSTNPAIAVLQATAVATVPTGNVYLYDGNAQYHDAQRLILAKTATLKTTVQATAEFQAPGSLVVTKTIAGPAGGSQGPVVLHVDCDDGVARDDLVIDARTPAGATSKTYHDIPAGTVCSVTETSNGSVVGTEVVVTGAGQQVRIPSGASTTVNVTDTYHHVGSLLVRKTIAGPGAGQQGASTIQTVCNGTALTPDFSIAAGTAPGEQTMQYDHIRLPATCTVTEIADGHTSAVSVIVGGSGQKVSVPAGAIVEADISDTYGLLPGQLEVTKTIAGPLAGQQGTVVIHTDCNGTALIPDLVITPGAPAGVQSQLYPAVPAGSCVVTETADGHTSAVSVSVAGSPNAITIPPGGAAAAQITDTYGPAPGSLLITKTIAGQLAGHQGPVTIHVVCDGTALKPDLVIASRTRAGSVSRSFDGIPAGSVCTVTETADGATATVATTVSGNGQKVTVPAGKVVPVNVIDVYQRPFILKDALQRPRGFLKVAKTLAGPAARQHGRIAILVACGGPQRTFAFLIRAHTAAGSVSRSFASLPAGSRCTVTETTNGHTATVTVVASSKRKRVTIRANGGATVHLTDRFARRARRRATRPVGLPPGLG
jgi:hypothetical protein